MDYRRIAKSVLRCVQTPYSTIEKSLYARGILSTKRLCLPDFLGLGAAQAGSTWLYENLRQHPEVYLPETKELRYFDLNFYRSLRSYAAMFEPGKDRVKGEINPGYGVMHVDRIRFVRKIMPDVRLIFLMRNPPERVWAAVRRIVGRETGDRFDEADESKFFALFDRDGLVKRTDYVRIVDNWLTVFPPEQLYVGFFDDIVHRPKALLVEIFRHIGVSENVRWDLFPYKEVINRNPAYPIPAKLRAFLQNRYRKDIEELHRRFGRRVESWCC